MPILLSGNDLAKQIKQDIRLEADKLTAQGIKPHLAAILVGTDGASQTYVASKVKDCAEVGFDSTLIRYINDISEAELLAKIAELNANDAVHGILVQLPLPKHISVIKVTEAINAEKDVDGFHPINVGRMAKNLPAHISATPLGILMMLERYGIATAGKHVVVIGRSQIVGSPMSILMARNATPGNATVTICHSHTVNLQEICLQADILIPALGKPAFVKANMVKQGAVVIDVGITRVEDTSTAKGYKLVGDVDFEAVKDKCSHISPVPGGVGPMTRMGLLQNTLRAAKMRAENQS